MSDEEVLYDVAGGVATITLNRPAKLNAWTMKMADLTAGYMEKAEKDAGVRVIIFTGAGRGFCAGADMSLLADAQSGSIGGGDMDSFKKSMFDGPKREGVREDFQKKYSYFPAIGKPIIGAINGASAGVGMVLPLYCDIRFASDQAKFTTSFARRGLISEYGMAWLLPRIIGMSNALDLLFSARTIDSAEALRMGLVSRVIPADRFMDEVRAYANELATLASPRSQRVIKKMAYEAWFQTLGEAVDLANEEMVQGFFCSDFQEGVAHYLEKRPPNFTGN